MANTGMLVSMKPTSISHSGTSASVNNNGGVDFTAVTSLSLNGVFTGDYDNYRVVMQFVDTNQSGFSIRFRASGTDASGANYTYQDLHADGGVTGSRTTGATQLVTGVGDQLVTGHTMHIYGPYLAQPTAHRSLNTSGANGTALYDFAGTHSLSTSYDGLTVYPNAGSFTGTVHVFGYRE